MARLSDEARKALLEMKGSVRNDTPDPVERTVGKLLLDGVELTYGEMKVFAQGHAVQQARDMLAQETPERRRQIAQRVAAALAKSYPKVLRNNFTKKVADNFYENLLLWHVLKETPTDV